MKQLQLTDKSFLNKCYVFICMNYESNDRVENNSSGLLVVIIVIAIAVSLLGIMVAMN